MPGAVPKPTLAVAFAIALVVTVGQAAEDPRRDILEADARYIQAVLGVDRHALAELFADDVRVVHATGRVDGKAGIIDILTHLRFQSYRRDNVDIRVLGETALLFATTHKVYQSHGETVVDHDVTLIVYARRDDNWRIVALQNTPQHATPTAAR